VQTPASHVSLCVQALPSLQPVPLVLFTTVQPPEPLQLEPDWHWFGVQLYAAPAQAPLVQTSPDVHGLLSLHPVMLGLLLLSMQVWAPVAQDVTPVLHWFGFVLHAAPAVHGTHAPALLQTRLVPQPVPAAFCVLSLHTIAPVAQLLMPV